MLSLYLM